MEGWGDISSSKPWRLPMINILKKNIPIFLLKLIFEIRYSDAPLTTEVIFSFLLSVLCLYAQHFMKSYRLMLSEQKIAVISYYTSKFAECKFTIYYKVTRLGKFDRASSQFEATLR